MIWVGGCVWCVVRPSAYTLDKWYAALFIFLSVSFGFVGVGVAVFCFVFLFFWFVSFYSSLCLCRLPSMASCLSGLWNHQYVTSILLLQGFMLFYVLFIYTLGRDIANIYMLNIYKTTINCYNIGVCFVCQHNANKPATITLPIQRWRFRVNWQRTAFNINFTKKAKTTIYYERRTHTHAHKPFMAKQDHSSEWVWGIKTFW